MYRKIISIILCILMIIALCPTASLAQSMPLNDPTVRGIGSSSQIEPNGSLIVYLLTDEGWQEVGSLFYDRFLRERKMDLGGDISSSDTITLRLVQKGGGNGHLDAVFLGGEAPVKVNDAEGLAIKKLSEQDFDVMDIGQEGIELIFDGSKSNAVLAVSARIEAMTISQTPFLFPVQNTEWAINEGSDFYTYQMNSNAGTPETDKILSTMANQEPFFKHHCLPGSGHPQGYVYGWVMNDEENLYVALDVTIDNTMDGAKDYGKVYVKTAAGIKEFKLSVPEKEWGKTSFVYTDKVAYQHKIYEFIIPFQELDMDESRNTDNLALAFSVYGTAAEPIIFESGEYVYDENAGTIGIKVMRPLAASYSGRVYVRYTISEGTAKQGIDYSAQEGIYSGQLILQDKQGEATIEIEIIDDNEYEPDRETLAISLEISDGYARTEDPSQTTVFIRDNDEPQNQPKIIQFSQIEYETQERDGVTIEILRSGDVTEAASVTYVITDGTAKNGQDFNMEQTGQIAFKSGEKVKTLWIPIVNDFEDEPDETFTITLSNPTNGFELGELQTTTVRIIDNDEPPTEPEEGTIQFERAAYSVNENAGNAVITVTYRPMDIHPHFALSSESGSEENVISVVYGTSNGTAHKGSDYTETTGILTFAEGETSKTFHIPILDDSVVEGNETVNLMLSGPTGGASLGRIDKAVLTIVDNDVPPSSGGGGGGGSRPVVAPPKEIPPSTANLPDGTLIDRMKGYIAFGDPIKIEDMKKKEILVSYNTELSEKNTTHTPRVYYWNTEKKNWVALATYPSEKGKVKAINDGGYKGWFVVFGVIEPAFSDSQGNWADQIINRMNGLGMIEGYPIEGETMLRTAKPERQVTHAEFTMFISRILNIDIDDPKMPLISIEESRTLLRSKFTDADEIPAWVLQAAGTLAKAGLLVETSEKFQADVPITRIESAVMTSKALKILATCKPADLGQFADKGEIPDWAKSEVVEGAISGYPDGSLRPNGNITRAEALALLYRIFVEGLGW